ncbi:peroxiredoxin [Patescibacteria group bacterium]|nr:peroxiredoxin [Patescibacteria group bacterium]
MLKVGDKAPDFLLQGYFKDKFKGYSLKDFKGRWLVIFFYRLDFSVVCPTELVAFNTKIDDFHKLNTALVGVSVDSVFSHKKWVEELGELEYPLLSDFNKRTSRDYNVLLEEEGTSLRSTFIIDPDGIVRYMVVADNYVGRSVPEIVRVLAALQTGKMCPAEWRPGDSTLS